MAVRLRHDLGRLHRSCYHPMGKVERTNNGWQLSPFFWHPIDKHDFSKLQTEVIGIQRRSTAKPVPTGPPPTMTTC